MSVAAILQRHGLVPAVPDVSTQAGTPVVTQERHVPAVPVVPAREQVGEEEDGVCVKLRSKLERPADCSGVARCIVRNLSADDIRECRGLPRATARVYLRAQEIGLMMDRGLTPPGYSKAVECAGCGSVLLWPSCPDRVTACPWCFRRKAGKPIPRPL